MHDERPHPSRAARIAAGAKVFMTTPVGYALLVFAGAFALQHPILFPGGAVNASPQGQLWLYADEATAIYDAARIASGRVPYRDFFQFQGPVHYHLYGALFWVFGRNFELARVLAVVITSLGGVFIALIVRRLLNGADAPSRRWSGIAGAACAFTHATGFVPFWPCTYPHWTAEALALAGIAVAVLAPRTAFTRAGAGALFGLSAWTIVSVGAPALVAAGVLQAAPGLAARRPARALREAGAFFGGVALVSLVVVVYFASRGALKDLAYSTLEWPFRAYGKGQGDLSGYATYFRTVIGAYAPLGAPWSQLGRWLAELVRAVPLIAFAGVVPAGVIALRELWRPGEARRWDAIFVVGTGAAAVSPVVLEVSRTDMVHVAFVASFGLLGTMGLWSLLVRAELRPTMGAALTGLSAAMVMTSYLGIVVRTERVFGGWEDHLRSLPETQRIERHLAESGPLFDTSYWGALRYFYLRDAATSFTYVPPANVDGYLTDAQWERLTAELLENAPSVLHTDAARFQKLQRYAPEIGRRYVKAAHGIYVLERAQK